MGEPLDLIHMDFNGRITSFGSTECSYRSARVAILYLPLPLLSPPRPVKAWWLLAGGVLMLARSLCLLAFERMGEEPSLQLPWGQEGGFQLATSLPPTPHPWTSSSSLGVPGRLSPSAPCHWLITAGGAQSLPACHVIQGVGGCSLNRLFYAVNTSPPTLTKAKGRNSSVEKQ